MIIDITERVARQAVVNNPSLRGQPVWRQAKLPGPNLRLVTSLRGGATQRDLDRAIQSGSFTHAKFSTPEVIPVQLTVPEVREMVRRLELEALTRPGTRAGLPIKRVKENESARLARERRIRISTPKPRFGTVETGFRTDSQIQVARSTDLVNQVNKNLAQVGGKGISSSAKQILTQHAIETGVGKINADFMSGRISRRTFERLLVNASDRARELESERVKNIREELLAPNFLQRVDKNVKDAIAKAREITPSTVSVVEDNLASEQKRINLLAKALEEVAPGLDKKIQAGTASAREIKQFNSVVRSIELAQANLNARITRIEKVEKAKVEALPRTRQPGFVGELTIGDVVKEFEQIPVDAGDAGKWLSSVLKTKRFDRRETVRLPDGRVVRKLDLASGVGAAIGGALSFFNSIGALVSFSVQERFKNVVPSGEIVVPKSVVSLVRSVKQRIPGTVGQVGEFFVTNPLKFVKVEDGRYIITPRAAGETGRAAFDVILLFSPGAKAGNILKVSKAGKPLSFLGKFSVGTQKVQTSFFNKLKVKNLQELAVTGAKIRPLKSSFIRSLRKIPEFNALAKRIGFEAVEITKGVGQTLLKTQAGLKKLGDAGNKFLLPLREKVEYNLIDAKNFKSSAKLYARELNNLRKRTIDEKIILFAETQAKKISALADSLRPTLIRKGDFNQFKKLKELASLISNSFERASVFNKKGGIVVKRAIEPLAKIMLKANKLFDSKISNRFKNYLADYKTLVREIKKEKKNFTENFVGPQKKKFSKKIDSLLFEFQGRSDILADYFKSRKKFKELTTKYESKRFRNDFLKDLKNLEDAAILSLPSPSLARKDFSRLLNKFGKQVSKKPSVIKVKRAISRVRNSYSKAIKDLESIEKSASASVKKKFSPYIKKQKKRMIETRNDFIKRIKGKKLTGLEKASAGRLQRAGVLLEAERFENAVKIAVKQAKAKERLLLNELVLPKPKAEKVGQVFRKKIKQRGLVIQGIKKMIEKGESIPKINETINQALKGKRITVESANKLKKLSIQKSLSKAGLGALAVKKIISSPTRFEKANKILTRGMKKSGKLQGLSKSGLVKIIKSGRVTPISELVGKGKGRVKSNEINKLINDALDAGRINKKTADELVGLNIRFAKRRGENIAEIARQARSLKIINQARFKNLRLARKIKKIKKRAKGIRGRKKPTGAERRKNVEKILAREKEFMKRETAKSNKIDKQVQSVLEGIKSGRSRKIREQIFTAKKGALNIVELIQKRTIRRNRILKNIEKNLATQRRNFRKELRIKVEGLEDFPNRKLRRVVRRAKLRAERLKSREKMATNKELRLLAKTGLVRTSKELKRAIQSLNKKLSRELDDILTRRVNLQKNLDSLYRQRDLLSKSKLTRETIRKINSLNVKIKKLSGELVRNIRREKDLVKSSVVPKSSLVDLGKIKKTKISVSKPEIKGKGSSVQIQRMKDRIKIGELPRRGLPKPIEKPLKPRRGIIGVSRVKTKTPIRIPIIRPKIKTRVSDSVLNKARNIARERSKPVVVITQKQREQLTFKGRQNFKPVQTTRIRTTSKAVIVEVTKIVPKIISRLKPIQRITPKITLITKQIIEKKPPVRPIPFILPTFEQNIESLERKKVPFNVIVRARGKETKLNIKPVTVKTALSLGHKFVENTPSRSFFVSKARGKPVKLGLKGLPARQYRKPKGRTNLKKISLVEKSRFAINTRGEKTGITLKGIAQNIKSRKVRNILNPRLLKKKPRVKRLKRRRKKNA